MLFWIALLVSVIVFVVLLFSSGRKRGVRALVADRRGGVGNRFAYGNVSQGLFAKLAGRLTNPSIFGPGPASLVTSWVDSLVTTDGTPTAFPLTFACPDGTALDVIATITGRSGSDVFCQDYRARYIRAGGALALVAGTTVIGGADPIATGAIAAATATFVVSGDDVTVQVTGVAATTIDWSCAAQVQQVQ